MTFDDDFVQLEFDGGTRRVACKKLGLGWPPPETLEFASIPMVRESMSIITDEQRADMTHICRGARYAVAPEPQGGEGK